MNNLPLEKRLKEVGYPQPIYGLDASGKKNYGCWKHYAYIPTLSELIKECGNDFGELVRVASDKYVEWIARADSDVVMYEDGQSGKTPEEAVMRLYLASNEKSVEKKKKRDEIPTTTR